MTISVIGCLVFLTSVFYLEKKELWNIIFWDFRTVTIADFTVEIKIPEECWNDWKKLQKIKAPKTQNKKDMALSMEKNFSQINI